MKIKHAIPAFIFSAIFLLIPAFVFWLPSSANAKSFQINIQNPLNSDDVEKVVTNIITELRTFVAGIAIAILIISGIVYVFSQGDEKRVTTAKRIMTGAVVGLIVILGAETILRELYIIFEKTPSSEVTNAQLLLDIVEKTLKLLLSATGVLGIIGLLWGGFLYLTSAGNEDQAELGKKQVVYSVTGIVIALSGLIIVTQIVELMK